MRGIRVVKSFVREDFEEKKFKNVSEDIYDDFVKAEKLLAFNAPLMLFCGIRLYAFHIVVRCKAYRCVNYDNR